MNNILLMNYLAESVWSPDMQNWEWACISFSTCKRGLWVICLFYLHDLYLQPFHVIVRGLQDWHEWDIIVLSRVANDIILDPLTVPLQRLHHHQAGLQHPFQPLIMAVEPVHRTTHVDNQFQALWFLLR